ncbi:hypothetical protein LSTR_LSTR003754 [Laodelphax striatellus]|uniref:Uncharacterized protein n=1 Tax=Laodelphax striatellus TaxID=195883 RepID=A0A482WP44_LAOST|nr:hypothetical protein LSTR_LSTR003754 [Laodelphax striatellus]
MSRRKQAKPRSLKRDEEDWPEGKSETVIGEGEEVESKDQEDDEDEEEDADEEDNIGQRTSQFSAGVLLRTLGKNLVRRFGEVEERVVGRRATSFDRAPYIEFPWGWVVGGLLASGEEVEGG